MSGITPLLDTLLHDVLGRRIELPARPSGPGPVAPVPPSSAAPVLPSDQGLETRPHVLISRATGQPGEAAAETAGRQAPPPAAAPGAIRLSPTASLIAALLSNAPATAAPIRPSLPLLPLPLNGSPNQLAQRLQGSIQESGLFYESHLQGWYQGKVSQAQLSREPQMRLQMAANPALGSLPPSPSAPAPEMLARTLNLSPDSIQGLRVPPPALSTVLSGTVAATLPPASAATPGAPLVLPAFVSPPPAAAFPLTLLPAAPVDSAARPSAGAAPAAPGITLAAAVPPLAVSAAPAGGTAEAAQAHGAAAGPAPLEREGNPQLAGQTAVRELAEPLQDIVQRQLQVLAAPVLRWEGDVWTGLFMALMIQPPREELRERQPGAEDGREPDGGEEGSAWRSEFTLRAGDLGALRVQLWLRGSELELNLRSASASAHARLEAGLDTLRQRLCHCGFPEPRLSLLLEEGEAGHG